MKGDRIEIYRRPRSENAVQLYTCPGCGHPITWRLVAEVVDELGILERTICLGGEGCHMWFLLQGLFKFDQVHAAHGRAPAVATGVRRVLPSDRVVIVVQGDSDMASEGCAEIIHAAARAERITAIMCNNAGSAETGGHLCATTLMGQRTKTSPSGRNLELHGHPLQLAEMLSGMPGVSYVARGAICSPLDVRNLKRMIRRAIETQMFMPGLSFVEVLSPCPTGWGVAPFEALKFVAEKMVSFYPVGELKGVPPEKMNSSRAQSSFKP